MEGEDFLQKIIQTGVEMQNKAVDVMDDLLKKGKIDPDETTKFMDNLHKNIDEYKEKTEKMGSDMFGKVGGQFPFVTKKAFDELKEEVDTLKAQVEGLTKSKSKTKKPKEAEEK